MIASRISKHRTDIILCPGQSIQQAVDEYRCHGGDVDSRQLRIFLEPGVYREKLCLVAERLSITGLGRTAMETRIVWDDYATKAATPEVPGYNGMYGTFNTATAFFRCEQLNLASLCIENLACDASVHGQAIALYSDCRSAVFNDCVFLGAQDTVFLAPLPSQPIIPHSFAGPGEQLERLDSEQHFMNCRIEGAIDFIFGSAQAWFHHCHIHVRSQHLKPDQDPAYYVCAPSTAEGSDFGFVFIDTVLTHDPQVSGIFLGRPWRNCARASFVDLQGAGLASLHPDYFHDWGKTEARTLSDFSVSLECLPAGRAGQLPPWVRVLSVTEAGLVRETAQGRLCIAETRNSMA